MAFSSYQNSVYGTADKTSSTSITTGSVFNTIPAGKLVIAIVSKDNSSTTDTNSSEVTGITDTAGNTYTLLREYAHGSLGANASATVSVWYSILDFQLTAATHTATASFASAVTAKTITSYAFSIGAATTSISAAAATDSNATTGFSLSGLSSKEYLFLIAIAAEGVGTDVSPNYTNYTNWGTWYTSGGGTASNMGASHRHRILTGTGDTPSQSNTPTTRDSAIIFMALEEVAPADVYPRPTRVLSRAVQRAANW